MLTEADFNTHLYPEIISVIDRDDDNLLDEAIAAAEGEAIGYLSQYDTDALFELTGNNRDKTLMMRLKDMAIWHFIPLSGAGTDLELRKTRYDEALKWLKDIQSTKIRMKDWPLPEEATPGDNDIWKTGSKTTRETHF